MNCSRSSPRMASVATLVALAASFACGSDASGPAPPVAATPSALEATSPTTVATTVAAAVTVSVIVRDKDGAPMGGVPVSFSVMRGGGSVSPATLATDPAGQSSTSWSIGTAAGLNELRATVSGLQPLTFQATGQPGPVAQLEIVSGDAQAGYAGVALEKPLTVRALDAYDNPVATAPVTFAVLAGGGTITASPALTNTLGVASTGAWVLGSASIEQRLSASSGTAQAVFTARADICPVATLAMGVAVSGTLADGDCEVAGHLADRYHLNSATAVSMRLALTATAFTPALHVGTAGGLPVASSGEAARAREYCTFDSPPVDGCHTPSTATPGSPISLLAARGSLIITAMASEPPARGEYTLAADPGAGSVADCEVAFVQRGITTTQQLAETDCGIRYGTEILYHTDDLKIYLAAGTQLEITVSSSAFTPWVEVFSPAGRYIGACVAPGSATCTFLISSSGYYLLAPSSFEERATGTYYISVR